MDPSGNPLVLSDLCSYWNWGVWEEFSLRGLAPIPGRARLLWSRLKARRDRRHLWRIYRPASGDARWLYVVRANPSSWGNQFQPVLEELSKRCPEVGVVVHEEIPRGKQTRMAFLGKGEAFPVPRKWRYTTPPKGHTKAVIAGLQRQLDDWSGKVGTAPFLERLLYGWKIHGVILRRWLDHLQAAHRRFPPEAFLLNNDLEPIRRSATALALKGGVPVVALQHGIINEAPPYRLPLATKHLLWGQAFADILSRNGVPADRYCVVGAPQYEGWPESYRFPRPVGRPCTLLYAAQPAGWEMPAEACLRVLECHKKLARRLPELQVRVRLHPRELPAVRERCHTLFASTPNLQLDASRDIREALGAADLVSTVFSAVTVDAVAARRPVLLLDFAGEGHRMPLQRIPPLYSVPSEEAYPEVVEAVRRRLETEGGEDDWRRFTAYHLANLDGSASRNAAEAILKVMERACPA